jgi:hypothetical protein
MILRHQIETVCTVLGECVRTVGWCARWDGAHGGMVRTCPLSALTLRGALHMSNHVVLPCIVKDSAKFCGLFSLELRALS